MPDSPAKRAREARKRRKKEEKRDRKLHRKENPLGDEEGVQPGEGDIGSDDQGAPPEEGDGVVDPVPSS